MEIEIKNLMKRYGKKLALNNVDLHIDHGMFGLLGANGAGKTTLLRILATILNKTSGTVRIGGIPVENVNEVRKYIGYLPQEFSLYPHFTLFETMEYFCALSKIDKNPKVRIYELLETVNLLDSQKLRNKALSGGMKRRLGIAIALINQPQLLLVDEPTAGLDPEERMKFRNLLTLFSEKRTVILSTHIIGDIEETCDKLAIIKKGNIIFNGSVHELQKETQGLVWELICNKDKLNEIMNKNIEQYILSQVPLNDNYRIRILTESKPSDDATLVESKIEDSYIKLMHIS